MLKEISPRVFVNENQCWIWSAGKDARGYPICKIKNKTHKVSRVVYEIFRGKIPKEFDICHRCDTPACINPKHLWAATSKENMHDCVKKGRFADHHGENNPRAKLTELDVQEILSFRRPGITGVNIAKRFGVSSTIIYSIWNNKSWRNI